MKSIRNMWRKFLIVELPCPGAFTASRSTIDLDGAGAEEVAGLEWEDEHVTVASDRRLPGIHRGRKVQIIVDGSPVSAFEGESVAASLLAAGRRGLRMTPERGEPRGMYCGIGVCFDCVMTFDGQRAARACLTPVRDGLRIDTRRGNGSWPVVGGGEEGSR